MLFADVVGSMKLAAALDVERLQEIMNEMFNRAAAVVQRYQGTLDKFTGDGLMALFGAPIALEDHALRACISALEIQSVTKEFAAKVRSRDGVDLQIRVGLNSGEVVVGRHRLRPEHIHRGRSFRRHGATYGGSRPARWNSVLTSHCAPCRRRGPTRPTGRYRHQRLRRTRTRTPAPRRGI